MDWAESLNDDSLGGKDQVESQKSDPAALQYSMQRYRIPEHSTTYISAISQRIELKFRMMTLLVESIKSWVQKSDPAALQ